MNLSRLHLVRLSRVTRVSGATQYGDPCPECGGGAIGVYCVEHSEQRTTRYLCCRTCGWKPPDSKWVTSEPAPAQPCGPTLSQLVLWS